VGVRARALRRGGVTDGTDWLHGEVEPFAGEARVLTEPWDEAALTRRDAFDASRRDAGLDDTAVREALELRDEAAAEAEHWDTEIQAFRERTKHIDFAFPPQQLQGMVHRRSSVLNRLRDWVAHREFQVDAREDVELPIPLFVLAAPDRPGCSATVETRQDGTRALQWSVKIFGTGLGGNATLAAGSSSTFSAASGEIKVVFLPVSLPVENVTVFEDGDVIACGRRVDASKLERSGELGLLLLPKGASPPIGPVAQRFPLSGDTTEAVATFQYTYERSGGGELSVGAKAFGAELKLEAKVDLSESVTVTYELVAGVDYELHRLAEGDGLVWWPLG